jgi:hypothetical protein
MAGEEGTMGKRLGIFGAAIAVVALAVGAVSPALGSSSHGSASTSSGHADEQQTIRVLAVFTELMPISTSALRASALVTRSCSRATSYRPASKWVGDIVGICG